MNLKQTFSSIETWLQDNAPLLINNYNPPASAEQISQTEAALGVVFPASLREAYLCHNGEQPFAHTRGGHHWLSLDDMVERAEMLADLVKTCGEGWNGYTSGITIPVLDIGGGDVGYVESVDAETADSPLYEVSHETDKRGDLAPTFGAFIVQFLGELYAGQWLYDPEEFPRGLDGLYEGH